MGPIQPWKKKHGMGAITEIGLRLRMRRRAVRARSVSMSPAHSTAAVAQSGTRKGLLLMHLWWGTYMHPKLPCM